MVLANERKLKILALASLPFSGLIYQMGGLSFGVERLVLVLIALPIVVLSIRSSQNKAECSGSFKYSKLFGLWAVFLLISTLLTDNPLAHFPGYVISIAPMFFYFLFKFGRRNGEVLEYLLEPILWYMAVGAIVTYVGWRVLNSDIFEFFIDRGRAKLTVFEPNIFGSMLSFFMILHIPYFKFGKRHVILYVMTHVALVLCFSKAPYVSYLLGVACYSLIAHRAGRRIRVLFVVGLFLSFVVGLLFSSNLLDFYSLFLDRQDGVDNRMIGLLVAIQRFLDNPFLGNGALDFGLTQGGIVEEMGSDNEKNAWIWQMFVALAHDGGVIGVIWYVVFLGALIKFGIACARGNSLLHASSVSALLALIFSSQTTTLHLSLLFGVALGLVASTPKYLITPIRR